LLFIIKKLTKAKLYCLNIEHTKISIIISKFTKMKYECPHCIRVFSRRTALRNHIKTHGSRIDKILEEIAEEEVINVEQNQELINVEEEEEEEEVEEEEELFNIEEGDENVEEEEEENEEEEEEEEDEEVEEEEEGEENEEEETREELIDDVQVRITSCTKSLFLMINAIIDNS
jgi:hypothetical protein